MIKELDTVVLNTDLPEHGLSAGDLGTVVLEHKYGGYEVEFMTLDGETVAVLSLSPDQVRPVERWEIAHVRLVTRG
jgi:hypothetical protein